MCVAIPSAAAPFYKILKRTDGPESFLLWIRPIGNGLVISVNAPALNTVYWFASIGVCQTPNDESEIAYAVVIGGP